mmetsp:Transcript_34207/g.72887  ORF Transcript_34207/g.72887 Transcript_34207/m.72887 type:complete len:97 (+) Transcript_34207:288-578(+)
MAILSNVAEVEREEGEGGDVVVIDDLLGMEVTVGDKLGMEIVGLAVVELIDDLVDGDLLGSEVVVGSTMRVSLLLQSWHQGPLSDDGSPLVGHAES